MKQIKTHNIRWFSVTAFTSRNSDLGEDASVNANAAEVAVLFFGVAKIMSGKIASTEEPVKTVELEDEGVDRGVFGSKRLYLPWSERGAEIPRPIGSIMILQLLNQA